MCKNIHNSNYFLFTDIELYREAVDKFIGIMNRLAKQVEQEKRDAIIVSNKLASLSNKSKEDIAVLQVIKNQKEISTLLY